MRTTKEKLERIKKSLISGIVIDAKIKVMNRLSSAGATDQEMYDVMKEIVPEIAKELLYNFSCGHEQGEPLQ